MLSARLSFLLALVFAFNLTMTVAAPVPAPASVDARQDEPVLNDARDALY
ncbi:hypothetical protein DENSPDRAFT_885226 [Dentipellis sp. KUC8613]|nr:hypothetical protein DENSPDRAFT_885226 [Dentipellis sp. KUC8613]